MVIFAVLYLQPQCHPYRVCINCAVFYINNHNNDSDNVYETKKENISPLSAYIYKCFIKYLVQLFYKII